MMSLVGDGLMLGYVSTIGSMSPAAEVERSLLSDGKERVDGC